MQKNWKRQKSLFQDWQIIKRYVREEIEIWNPMTLKNK